jgi:ribosomal protein S18 acetylase RimI-like enzyme
MGRDPALYKNMVAVTGGKVVGFLSMVYYKSFYHQVGTALINQLVVSETSRNLGIGKALVRMAVDMAKADGLDEIEVGTETSNKGAIEFYKKAGFDEEYVLLGKEFTE